MRHVTPWPLTTPSVAILALERADDDQHKYDDMKQLDWARLVQAWQRREKGTVFWTTLSQEELESGLQANDLAFIPHYSEPGRCNGVDIPFCDGKHKASVRIKRVPDNHRELRDICQKVQDQGQRSTRQGR